MYAAACKRLSDEGPDFEARELKTGAKGKGPTTFLKLLLRKCQGEFETRKKAEALAAGAASGKFSDLVPGSEEFRGLMAAQAELLAARKRMLANVKFIGELAKIDMLSEKVVHTCIQLLCERVENPSEDDIECLCQVRVLKI